MQSFVPVIGPEEKFYGYVIGVSLERSSDNSSNDTPQKMFVRFEYGGTSSMYQVPDIELFEELTDSMLRNAQMRAEHGDYGYEKVYISRTSNGWVVDQP